LAATVLIVSGGVVIGTSVTAYATNGAPHVMVIMMENQDLTGVVGQADQPYTNSLVAQGGLANDSYAMVTGSLPNYLAIVSGSTQGIPPDNTPAQDTYPGTPTIADQLSTAGYSAKAYVEDLPADPSSDSGDYVVRHNPWPFFPNAPMPEADASTLVPDLNSADAPDFVWFSPNDIDDSDESTVQQGDAFLSTLVPEVQATSWYAAGGQIIIEWDESADETTGINGTVGGGNVPTIVVSAALAADPQQDSAPVDTVGILHSIEDEYGLAHLGGSAADGSIDPLLSATTPATTTSVAPSTTAAPTTTTTIAATTTTPAAVTTTSTTAAPTTTTTAPTTSTTGAGTTTTTTAPTGAPVRATSAGGTGSGGSGDPGGSGGSGGSALPGAVSASSGALAFTGPGRGIGSLVLMGAVLVLMGVALLGLVGPPRRRRAQLALAGVGGWSGAVVPGLAAPAWSRRSDLWLRPPS
jgi:acid phosphatase